MEDFLERMDVSFLRDPDPIGDGRSWYLSIRVRMSKLDDYFGGDSFREGPAVVFENASYYHLFPRGMYYRSRGSLIALFALRLDRRIAFSEGGGDDLSDFGGALRTSLRR